MGQQSVNRSKMAQFHRRAIELKNEADAMEEGTREQLYTFYEAYLAEREAALMFREHTDLEPERSIMFISAIGLLICSLRGLSEAFDLVTIALEGNPHEHDRKILEEYRQSMLKERAAIRKFKSKQSLDAPG